MPVRLLDLAGFDAFAEIKRTNGGTAGAMIMPLREPYRGYIAAIRDQGRKRIGCAANLDFYV